jgi:hypothetical protein
MIGFASEGEPDAVIPAAEVTWAGLYAVPVTPSRVGPHAARVVVAEVGGKRFEPALIVDVPLGVGPAPGMGLAAGTLVALVAGVALTALSVIGIRAARGVPPATALDLLEIGWVRRLLTSRVFQPALQIPLLALTAGLVVLGLRDVQEGGLNLATKLTWTIWWAGIIFTFVLAGRVWCLACLFGALTEWASRTMAPIRRLPRPFRNIWWATAAFVALTWLDEQLGVVRSPRVTAWIIVAFAALAVAVGLAYERRSFCRYLCPIGGSSVSTR